MPTLDDPDGMKSGQEKKMPKVKKDKYQKEEACNGSKKGVDCPVHGKKDCS